MMNDFLVSVSSSDVTAVLIFMFTFLLMYIHTRRHPDVPPGPSLWPVVGNLFSLAKTNPKLALDNLRKKYGDIYSIYLGQELTIFLNGYDVIHDALIKKGNRFSRRPESNFSRLHLRDTSLVFENGKQWKDNRAFVLQVFRELCFSRSSKHMSMEDRINEEVSYFVDKLRMYNKPVDVSEDLKLSLANVIYKILYGKRVGYHDEALIQYLADLDEAFKKFSRKQILSNCFPFLHKIPIDVLGLQHSLRVKACLKRHFADLLRDNMEVYEEGNEQCLSDWYITATKGNADICKNVTMKEELMWVMLHDLTAAGTETTATTIEWILLYLVRHPEIQERLYQEINATIGKGTPSLSDRQILPYVEATILEGLRIGQIVPMSIPHSVASDYVFRGYLIPKNTTVFINLSSVLTDPKLFPSPSEFKPERFLSSNGKTTNVPKELIPFSLGPRSCLGESLARMELFLYLTSLIQRFQFMAPEGGLPSTQGWLGITHHPNRYRVQIVAR